MDEIEVPQYFVCPISLQLMMDPVTTVSGITYDRESIERWLSTARDTTCPVTKQQIPRDSDLMTPNHTLRRLIQAWCVANASFGVDRIPTPKPPLSKSHVSKLIRNLNAPRLRSKALKEMEELAEEGEKNRVCMAESGAIEAMVMLIIKCFQGGEFKGLEEGLKILHLIWNPTMEAKQLVKDNFDLIESLQWILRSEESFEIKIDAISVLKMIVEVVSSSLIERLKLGFFKEMVNILRLDISQQATKSALNVLIEACPWGRNRTKIVESGAVFELIEIELNNNKPEKKVSELIFSLLARLCSCADGRAKLLSHAGGVALVAKRILRVSGAIDDRAIQTLSSIAKFSATHEVLLEMLRVGAVSKLCMVLQADSPLYLKNKAREVLRMHSQIWSDSPCIAVHLLTKEPR